MPFTIITQLSDLYVAIEDLRELGVAAQTPFSEPQLINIALDVLKRVGDYERSLEG